MDLTELIKESQTFDQPCKFAGNCNGHSIYCNSEASSAPRKCTYRMHPDGMEGCHLFEERSSGLGDISKPLLADVVLTENEKWKTVCETVIQHAFFESIHVSDTIELLKSKFNLV